MKVTVHSFFGAFVVFVGRTEPVAVPKLFHSKKEALAAARQIAKSHNAKIKIA